MIFQNSILKFVDKNFKDKCKSNIERNMGILMMIATCLYIISIGIAFVMNLVTIFLLFMSGDECYGLKMWLVIESFIDLIVTMFAFTFLRTMAYRCRGFVGYLIIFLSMIVYNSIMYYISKIIKDMYIDDPGCYF
uniref:Uncharacterized protein n=1 Tax=viral metagenome TaxID=1070528 RepID=A0A6C0CZ94_9ZZZZ